ncbi:hypothetical protein, partial [Gordonibacter sp.]|uniref:hypothetical protein n=1 Tax=Gordonibacter sp. TaxID=1968902 RepID=UPI002FC6A3A0
QLTVFSQGVSKRGALSFVGGCPICSATVILARFAKKYAEGIIVIGGTREQGCGAVVLGPCKKKP